MTTGREKDDAALARVAEHALPPLIADVDSLLRPVGPLALVAVAAGAFASLLPTTRWGEVRASLDDAMRISASHVLELARYVEQKSPEVLWQLPGRLDDSRLLTGSISGALLLLALRRWQQRKA
jgi:hypothetical protein